MFFIPGNHSLYGLNYFSFFFLVGKLGTSDTEVWDLPRPPDVGGKIRSPAQPSLALRSVLSRVRAGGQG